MAQIACAGVYVILLSIAVQVEPHVMMGSEYMLTHIWN